MDTVRSLYRSLGALVGFALLGASTAGCVMGADLPDEDEAIDEAEQAIVTAGPLEVGLVTMPPNAGGGTQRVAFTTQRNYASPLVFATAQGGAAPGGAAWLDTFAVSTTSISTNGFSANLFRSDAAAGWAQPLKLGWMAMQPFSGQNTQSGRAWVGAHNAQQKTIFVPFPKAFVTPPKVILNPRAADYVDTFSVTTRWVSNTGFMVNIRRTDANFGWGLPLELDWLAWDSAAELAPYGAADGTSPISAPPSGRVSTVWVPFGKTFSQPPAVLATARGQDYVDTFAVTASLVSTTGFYANVGRVDYNGGWGQALQLDWLAIPPGSCPTGQELNAAGTCVATSPAPQPPAGMGNTLYGRWTVSGGSPPLAPGNQTFLAEVNGTTGPVQFDLWSATDVVLYLYGPDGSLIASDDNGGGGTNARIQVSLASGTYRLVAATKSFWVPGEFSIGSNKAFLHYPQRLEVQRADQFDWVYDDVGTGSDGDVTVWRPRLSAYPGYYSLGDVAMPWHGAARGTYVVKGEGDLLARPVDYNFMWADWGSGGDHDASVWDPIPPTGYTCIGTVVTLGYNKPSTDLIRCIKSEYVMPANGVYVWDDNGSGADRDISFNEAMPYDFRALPLGTFATLPYYGNPGGRAYFALNKSATVNPEFWGMPVTTATAQQYAPRVWLHGGERFFPSSTQFFLPNVHEEVVNGKTYKVTNQALNDVDNPTPPFLTGQRPDQNSVPVYAEIVNRTNTSITDVIYWQFYPYNLGKEVCIGGYDSTLGCFGYYHTFGNHVGDWEHVTVRFVDGRPSYVYLSAHDEGRQLFFGEKFITIAGLHPEVFAAHGSHGLYTDEGRHYYKSIGNGDKLADDTHRGIAWDTWNNVVTFSPKPVGSYQAPLDWMNYVGYWGDPEWDCMSPYLVGLGLPDVCSLEGGPEALVTRNISWDANFLTLE